MSVDPAVGADATRNRAAGARGRRHRNLTVVAVALAACAWSASAAEDPAAYFRANCSSCHTIGGGRLTGPDLKDVAGRKESAWLMKFIADPKAMIDSGDPYAARLLDEARGVIMPTVPGMSAERASALLDLIAAESRLERSQFAGLEISDAPFTAGEVALGRALFQGRARLSAGGASCLSCHAVRGGGGLGGGRLGPDLTRAYERLGGRRPLATWLTAPATPTMQAVFAGQPLTSAEILPLVAYLETAAQAGGEAESVPQLNLFLLGLGGAVLALALSGALWKTRFRAVRRPMVRGEWPRGEA